MVEYTLRSAAELEDAASRTAVPVIAERRPGFRGRLDVQPLSETAAITEARMTPLRTFRTARMARRTERDDLLIFCMHVTGSGLLSQHDQAAELSAGAGVLYEAGRSWDLDVATDTRCFLLQIPRDTLPIRPAEITGGVARRIDPAMPAMRLLSGYIGHLFQLAGTLTGEQRHDAALAGIDMLTMTLRGAAPAVPAEPSAGAVLLDMMCGHVRDHLGDRRLSVAELARRHHVSVRHAYTLFSRIGLTPGAYIREQRLIAAREMLSDPRHHTRAVAEIGVAVGLFELRTFERAFLRQFGTTPAGWRRDHRG